MKYFILFLLFMSVTVFADCNTSSSETSNESTTVSSVQKPKMLDGAKIVVTTADGKEYKFDSNEYMVAKRIKHTTVVEHNTSTMQICNKVPKNELMFGVRRDYTGVDKSVGPTSATLGVKKDAVLDAAYIFHEAFGTKLNLGVGVDTNGTPKGTVGFDF